MTVSRAGRDPRITVRPVVVAAGDQAHAVAVALQADAASVLISPERTCILGVSICGLHRVPSAGSAIGVGVTLSGVEGLKICGGPNGAPRS